MIFGDPSAPPPEGEHHPAVDDAPAADSKDAADEKMDGEWSRKRLEGFRFPKHVALQGSFGDSFLNSYNLLVVVT